MNALHVLLCVLLVIQPVFAAAQCAVSPSIAAKADDWDAIFTQDGPGKGLEPAGSPGWTGGDSTYSLLLSNGDSAFFFSDSYVGEWPRTKGDGSVRLDGGGVRMTELNCFPPLCEPAASVFRPRNSIVVLSKDRTTLKTLVGKKDDMGLSTSYFPEPRPGLVYWMGGAVRHQRSILVFLHKFDAKLMFHGAAVAQLDPKTLAIKKTIEINNLPDLSVHWGTAMIEDKGQLYIYGKGTRDGRKQMFVARTKADVSMDRLADASNWKGWNGRGWSSDLTEVAPIIPKTDGISDEFNVVSFKINGKTTYMFAGIDSTVPWGSWRDITLYSACSPQGPFTGKHVVYEMPESNSFTVPGLAPDVKLRQHLVVYNPHIHAQFSGAGRLLISYNLNRTHNSDTIYIDGYRPRFIYVPIAGLK
jgi:hypothetical protein